MAGKLDHIGRIQVGDIFHAEGINGASLICLVTEISDVYINARVTTTQLPIKVIRATGVAEWGEDHVPCTIDSVAPLPSDIRNIILRLDEKFRSGIGLGSDGLATDEKQALLFCAQYYRNNPLS